MVTDNQVRRLFNFMKNEELLPTAALKSCMDEKTARKYLKSGKLPSHVAPDHHWRTRKDPFEEIWPHLREHLEVNSGLEAKTLFEHLQRTYPGRFQDGQLRTLQRKIKRWRATEGPPKEVMFPQMHYPADLCQSDYTDMGSLRITIHRQHFPHLMYHFVLTYSNWETGMVCFSETFESLAEGLQKALWQLGGVPKHHRTDRLSAAVHKDLNPDVFTRRYQGLLDHYGLHGQKTQGASPNQNGDVEQSNHRFKRALDQALMLRGSRDFNSRAEYQEYVDRLFKQLNAGRSQRLEQELGLLAALPHRRMDAYKRMQTRVGPSSTIRVNHNVYSVNSRLIGETLDVRVYGEYLELWYGQKRVDVLPRLRGEGRHRIEYRHVIDWLVRKPGAFKNYRYHHDLFPTHRFRMAYDQLKNRLNGRGDKAYLEILYLAARENESAVDRALGYLMEQERPFDAEAVERLAADHQKLPAINDVAIRSVDLSSYDALLSTGGA